MTLTTTTRDATVTILPTGTTTMALTPRAARCAQCGNRMARDNADTVCSPCRRTHIEASARRAHWIVRDVAGAGVAFRSQGLHGVARHLGCTPEDALDVVLGIGVVPLVSTRRKAILRDLLAMDALSHVDAAQALGVSRWTIATYRQQLGLERSPSQSPRTGRRRSDLPC